jgi:hypothetical protein
MTIEPRTLVWIDSNRAVIVRWDGTARLTRIESEVPRHRRLGGHVQRDPVLRAMGSPSPERHRLEHLRRYLRTVADELVATDDTEVIGPGTVQEQLAALLRNDDVVHGRSRRVLAARAGPCSEAQLVARVRTAAGDAPKRGRRPGMAAPRALGSRL